MKINTIYHLSSCNTCQRIIGELGADNFELINIKNQHIDEKTLDWLAEQHGSYEALFNKRAMKYRAQGLNNETLTEAQWKQHILSEYTFLKRPIVIIDGVSYAGNAKKTVEAAKQAMAD